MKITIENTSKIVRVSTRPNFEPSIDCRVWEGVTDTGIRVQCLIPRIATFVTDDQEDFIRELQSVRPPTADFNAFPLRMVI